MADPLKTLWDALESQGWDPQGPEYRFRANCPGHGGDSHQLRVNEGNDGRALVFCHTAGCSAKAIVDALGLRMSDLFPPGHRNARSLPPVDDLYVGGPSKKVTDLLAMLDAVDEPWMAMVMTRCQFCGGPGGWFRIGSTETRGTVDCPDGCSERAYTQALTGRVMLVREEAELSKRRARAR